MAKQPDIRYINAYVSGTTAYKLEPVQPVKAPVKLPKQKKRVQYVIKVDPVAVLGAVVAAVMMISLLVGVVQLCLARHDEAVLESYVQYLQEENEQLKLTYSESYDLEEIRQIATAMGFVPRQQVSVLQIEVNMPQPQETVSGWDSFWRFVTEMFA